MFPQNHCKRQFGAALNVPEAVAAASDFGPAFGVSGLAGLALPLEFEEVVVGYFPHPAVKFQQFFLCSPFCNIVRVRSFSDA